MNQKDDALDVLGDTDEAKALVDELEEAKGKALPEGALVKAEEVEEPEPEQEPVEAAAEPEAEEEVSEPEPEPAPQMFSASEMTAILKTFTEGLSDAIDARLVTIDEAVQELKAQVEALSVEENEKVKAAVDSDGKWLWELMRKNSVRGGSTVKGKGGKEEPEEASGWNFISQYGPPNR